MCIFLGQQLSVHDLDKLSLLRPLVRSYTNGLSLYLQIIVSLECEHFHNTVEFDVGYAGFVCLFLAGWLDQKLST